MNTITVNFFLAIALAYVQGALEFGSFKWGVNLLFLAVNVAVVTNHLI